MLKQQLKNKIDKFLLNTKIPYLSFLVLRNKELEGRLRDCGKFSLDTEEKDCRNFYLQKNNLIVEIKPIDNRLFTQIKVINNNNIFEEKLFYSHLGLAKLITEYEFNTILDIGSRNGISARLFSFLNKKVTTIEMSGGFDTNYVGDYLEISFPEKFDAIWCSHVLEHQRNIGFFLDKIYQDLKEDGVLAITVPSPLFPLMIGHPNIFTVMQNLTIVDHLTKTRF